MSMSSCCVICKYFRWTSQAIPPASLHSYLSEKCGSGIAVETAICLSTASPTKRQNHVAKLRLQPHACLIFSEFLLRCSIPKSELFATLAPEAFPRSWFSRLPWALIHSWYGVVGSPSSLPMCCCLSQPPCSHAPWFDLPSWKAWLPFCLLPIAS